MDFYDLLEIRRDADAATIRKAYKKMAIKWHPDKNLQNKEEAEEMFKEIALAYEVLSDPDKRRDYDLYGREGPSSHDPNTQGSSGRHSQHQRSSGRARDPRYYAQGDPFAHAEDAFAHAQRIFEQVFGGQDPFATAFGGVHHGNGRTHARSHAQSHAGVGARADPRVSAMMNPFAGFGAFGGLGFGGGFGGGFGFPPMMMGMDDMTFGNGHPGFSSGSSMSFSSSSSSFSSSGGGGTSRSVSTSSFIDADGRRVTRTETRVTHPDGRVDSNVSENVDDGQGGRRQNRIGYR